MNRVQIIAAASLLTALTLGGAAVAATDSPSASVAATCQVTVDRSQTAGSFHVDRQTLSNGDCVCYVYTGPETQGGFAESRIADVRDHRACGATSAALATSFDSDADRKKKRRVPLYLALGFGTGGIIAALAGGGGDSTGG